MKQVTKTFLTTYSGIRNGTDPRYRGDSIANVLGVIHDIRYITPRVALEIASDLKASPAEASKFSGMHPDRIDAIAEALSIGLSTEAA